MRWEWLAVTITPQHYGQKLKNGARGERIAVRTGDRIVYVPVKDIEWCEAADNYVGIHANGKRHLIRMTIGRLERQLDPVRFVRVHRSVIVNMAGVRELRSQLSGDGEILLASGVTVRLSRSYRATFEERLAGDGVP